MEVFNEAPSESSFISLSVHQSQTPSSFYSGPPVLYFHSTGRLQVLKEDSAQSPAIEALVKESQTHDDFWLTEETEAWITSDKFLLWRSSISTGVSIPYPSISLHALGSIEEIGNPQGKVQALYLEVTITKAYGDDQDESMSLNFIPRSVPVGSAAADSSEDTAEQSICQRLYNAVTECADLHPDPISQPSSDDGDNEEGDQDGERPAFDYEVLEDDGMPPPFPGSSGWITAANAHEFFDEDGNWRAGGLGPGAGLVRTRQENEGQANGHHKDDSNDDEGTKWRRTD